MKLVTIRVEQEIINILDQYSIYFGIRQSDLIRDFIEAGISTKIKFKISLKMHFSAEIPVEDISLSEDQARLNFYLDPALLDDAKAVFSEDDQAVLRRVLRLAIFRFNNIMNPSEKTGNYPQDYQISIEANSEKPPKTYYKELQDYEEAVNKHRQNMKTLQYVSTYVITAKIQDTIQSIILPYLNKSSKKQILIVTGPEGSGKTHLIEFILAIAEHKKLAQIVKNRDLEIDLDSFAGDYIPIRLTDDVEALEQILKGLEEYESSDDRKNAAKININKKLEHLLEKYQRKHPEKQIIIYKKIETPEEAANNYEMLKRLSQNSLKIIIETNNTIVSEELVKQLPSTAIIRL